MVDIRYENCNNCWSCSNAVPVGSELECNYKKRILKATDVIFSENCIERKKMDLQDYRERVKR